MDLPLKVLCDLGGWKTAQTVLQCYQRPDEDRLRKALEAYPGGRFGVQLAGTICRNRPSTSRKSKWAWVDLNYRPHAYQACALTT